MTQLPALLTPAQVARELCVSDDSVHRWARDGRLQSITLPSGLKRFRREDIEAILATTGVGTEPAEPQDAYERATDDEDPDTGEELPS